MNSKKYNSCIFWGTGLEEKIAVCVYGYNPPAQEVG